VFAVLLACWKGCSWPTPVPFVTEFHVKRATAFHRKAELLELLIFELRMHPNGQQRSLPPIKISEQLIRVFLPSFYIPL